MPWVEYSGKDHQIESRQSELHADDHVGNLLRVFENLGFRMQAWHLVIHYRHADGVFAAANVTMKHVDLLILSLDFLFGFSPTGCAFTVRLFGGSLAR